MATGQRDVWPFKLKVTGVDSTGALVGELDWTTLSSVHRVDGALTETRITFTETAAIRRGTAILGCVYNLDRDQTGRRWVGRWSCTGESGTVWMEFPSGPPAAEEAIDRPDRYQDIYDLFRRGIDFELAGRRLYYNTIRNLPLGDFLHTFTEENLAAGGITQSYGMGLDEGATRRIHERLIDLAQELRRFKPSQSHMAWTVERFIQTYVVASSYGM